MDLSHPISSVIPSAYGPVLAVLVRAGAPMSGRQVASLVAGQVGRSRVNSVLGQLADSGLVLRDPHPPSVLYRFNRDHVAAESVEALASLRQLLIERMRGEVSVWPRPAVAVWLFGSAARGDGSTASDVDVLVVRPNALAADDPTWVGQVATLSEHVTAWSGNSCEILELSRSEIVAMVEAGERLVDELSRDALLLHGAAPASLLRRQRPAVKA